MVSRAVEGASGLGLVILDACRDNPFAAAMQRSGATRSIGRGLARVEPAGETLVAYAAKGGSVAADGVGRNSPYSTALLAHLEEPGLEVGLMFRKVRDAVLAATGRQQEPFVYGSLSSKGIYLSAPPAAVTPAPGVEAEDIANSDEQLFWASVRGSRDPADLNAYLEQFPDGVFAALARNRIERLSDPEAQPTGDPGTVEAALGLQRSERQRIQTALWAAGFDPASRDGLFDQKTRTAVGQWQASRGVPATGYLDVEAAKTLLRVAPDLSGGVWVLAADRPCKLWNPGPQPGEAVIWSGGCEDGKASGEGRAVWTTARGEETYEGYYRDGRKHGRGTAVWPDGRRYEGEWSQGKEHGKGAAIAADGTRYEGEWQDGIMPDRGAIVWPHGRRYEGEWQDGEPHGSGVFTLVSGDRYEGEFRDGRYHGQGIRTWASGRERYEGEFQDGKHHGQGTWTREGGARYEGEWRAGKKHGRGIWTFATGARYEGEVRHNKVHGHGVVTWPNGSRYEGEWRADKRHGRGVKTWPSGRRKCHEGEYQYGKRHGRGVATFANGLRYEGEWREGKIHGPGVYFDKSGEKLAEGRATDGCFGKRNGIWIASGKSAKACGFK